MTSVNPFPESDDFQIVICIGNHKVPTQWPVVPRIGEVVHGYMLGSRMFSGRVIGIEHHFDVENSEIHVRLPSWSFIK